LSRGRFFVQRQLHFPVGDRDIADRLQNAVARINQEDAKQRALAGRRRAANEIKKTNVVYRNRKFRVDI
jgi:hypothetical protein